MGRSSVKRSHVVLVAVASATVMLAAPVIAGPGPNAQTLSPGDFVGCKASVADRAGAFVATCASGPRAGYLPNNIIRRAVNSARLGGRNVADFDDAETLDGQDSSDFLGASATAVDSNLLGGRNAADFDNADTLDGRDSTEFLGASSTAANSNLLDGLDSTAFLSGNMRLLLDGRAQTLQPYECVVLYSLGGLASDVGHVAASWITDSAGKVIPSLTSGVVFTPGTIYPYDANLSFGLSTLCNITGDSKQLPSDWQVQTRVI